MHVEVWVSGHHFSQYCIDIKFLIYISHIVSMPANTLLSRAYAGNICLLVRDGASVAHQVSANHETHHTLPVVAYVGLGLRPSSRFVIGPLHTTHTTTGGFPCMQKCLQRNAIMPRGLRHMSFSQVKVVPLDLENKLVRGADQIRLTFPLQL